MNLVSCDILIRLLRFNAHADLYITDTDPLKFVRNQYISDPADLSWYRTTEEPLE